MNLSDILPDRLHDAIIAQYSQQTTAIWFFGITCDDLGEFSAIVFAEKDRLPALSNSDLLIIYLPERANIQKQRQEMSVEDIPIRVVFIDHRARILTADEDDYAAVSLEEIESVFSEDGMLAVHNSQYARRDGQVDMALQVMKTLNDGGIVQVEAGTGVGKSFAYLIPAVHFSGLNNTRILISTASIPLQRQLISKDIPAILGALNSKLSAALIKGIQNYLCLDKLNQHDDFFDDFDEDLITQLRTWANSTETGDRDEVNIPLSDAEWYSVAADHDHCSIHSCPNSSRCFLKKARNTAYTAQILVTNHHLFLIDRDIRSASHEAVGVIPRYSHAIIDEAHRLSDIARTIFSEKIGSHGVLHVLRRIHHQSKQRLLSVLFAQRGAGSGYDERKTTYIQTIRNLIEQLSAAMQEFDQCMMQEIDDSEYTIPNAGKKELLLQACSHVKEYRVISENICLILEEMLTVLQSVRRYVEEVTEIEKHILYRFTQITHRLGELRHFFDHLKIPEQGDTNVQFVQQTDKSIHVWNIPLELGDLFHEKCIVPLRSIVFTSATLEACEAIHAWQQGLSVEEKRIHRVESPFHYEDQQLLAIPTDAPLVKRDPKQYVVFLADLIEKLAAISNGSMLVLFTSYQMLNDCAQRLQERGVSRSFTVLQQGSLPREQLLARFRKETSSILLGTDSFWQGIDVPGDALRMVVITRLPFKAPSGVFAQAREGYIRSQGKNPFMHMSVPEAVQMLKQGVGRLIRNEYDYGVVVVTDTRILQWKERFIDALPRSQYKCLPSTELIVDIAEFFRLQT